jgi:hypothetical protein
MATTSRYSVTYRFHDEPREHRFELEQQTLATHEAAMHLLQLHFGDMENSLIMPAPDATPKQIMGQALLLGITEIHCTLVD